MNNEIKMEREILDKIDALIREHKIVVFSKTTCPYCKNAKELIFSHLDTLIGEDAKESDVLIIELDKILDYQRSSIREILFNKTGQRTVPQIWINGSRVGGFTELVEHLHNA